MRRNAQVLVSVATMVRMRPGQRTRCSGAAGRRRPKGHRRGVVPPLGPVPTRVAAALISFLPKDLSRGTP
jgi:hypothetical protein